MSDTPIAEIKARLAHPYIRERQAALKEIAEKLDNNQSVRACVEVLQETIRTSEYLIVAQRAQQILDDWQRRSQIVRAPEDGQHIFGVVCPQCGQQNYFDKREVCASRGSIFLGPAADRRDELLLECQNQKCRAAFVVRVDCEGYR